MPSGLAAQARAALQEIDREGLVPRRATGRSSTGFVNVIEIKGKFQARLQVPGDGRGGVKKRKQVPLPGLFDKAEDAALYLASFTKGFLEQGLSAAEAAEMLIPTNEGRKQEELYSCFSATSSATDSVAEYVAECSRTANRQGWLR